jgi:hypothetical protein
MAVKRCYCLNMYLYRYKDIKLYLFVLIGFTTLCASSCRHRNIQTVNRKPQASFKSIIGINFTEVRRRLSTGLSFDKSGYQTEPSYKITFLKNDSASVYSPEKKDFINFLVFLEPDSIFNVARSYFKLKKMSRDSLIFQVLEVDGDTLHLNRSLVFMTFYANAFIKAHHIDTAKLGRPDRRDTLFIQAKALQASKNPDSAFAARQPVRLTSKSPLVTVQKKAVNADVSNGFDTSDEYLNPEFNINIQKAYDNFSYSFLVFVDEKGNMTFDKSLDYIMPEYKASTIKVLKGIIDGYLKYFVVIKPGSTLGIPHTSKVILNVAGRK